MATKDDVALKLLELRDVIWNNRFDVVSDDLKFTLINKTSTKLEIYNKYIIMIHETKKLTSDANYNVYDFRKGLFESFDKLIKEYLGEITFK